MNTRAELRLKRAQWQVFTCPKRFRVLAAGRRFGKTYLALHELLRAALQKPNAIAWYVAPTYRQAKRIAWSRLKELVRRDPAHTISETDLSIYFQGAGSIALRGADRVDGLRGNGLDFVVLDEFATMKPQVWSEVLRPALADRRGRALFIGTPQGHNHSTNASKPPDLTANGRPFTSPPSMAATSRSRSSPALLASSIPVSTARNSKPASILPLSAAPTTASRASKTYAPAPITTSAQGVQCPLCAIQ